MHQSHYLPRLLTKKKAITPRFFGNRRIRIGASLLGLYLVMMVGFSYAFGLQSNYTSSQASADSISTPATSRIESINFSKDSNEIQIGLKINNGSSTDYISAISVELISTKDIITWTKAEPENKLVNFFYPSSQGHFEFPSQSPYQESSYKVYGKILDKKELSNTLITSKINYKINSSILEAVSNKEFIAIDKDQKIDLKVKKSII